MKGWLKKLVDDFSGASSVPEDKPVVITPPPAASAPAPQPAAAPAPQPKANASIQEFEKAREDFFAALKKDDAATVGRIAAAFPGEAINWRTNDGTPLQIAQVNNSINTFKALITLGLDKEESYPGGSFPLHMAQEKGQKDFFDYLLEAGANIERTHTEKAHTHGMSETHARTALGTAIKMGDKDAVIALLERGADTTAPYAHHYRLIGMMGSPSGTPTPSTAVEYATNEKQFLIADIAKRAAILHNDYLARQAAPAPAPVAEEVETASDIGVMSPLRLKKQPGLNG